MAKLGQHPADFYLIISNLVSMGWKRAQSQRWSNLCSHFSTCSLLPTLPPLQSILPRSLEPPCARPSGPILCRSTLLSWCFMAQSIQRPGPDPKSLWQAKACWYLVFSLHPIAAICPSSCHTSLLYITRVLPSPTPLLTSWNGWVILKRFSLSRSSWSLQGQAFLLQTNIFESAWCPYKLH